MINTRTRLSVWFSEWSWAFGQMVRFFFTIPQRCSRCTKIMVHPEDYEHCWYCGAYLCYRCWEHPSHCGHKTAYIEIERMRTADCRDIEGQLRERSRMWKGLDS